MDAIFYFLNQPIVLTLITLIVGSYLLNLVAERRSLRDKLRDQAIEFLTDASNHVGLLVPHIYEQLRTRNLKNDSENGRGITKPVRQTDEHPGGQPGLFEIGAFLPAVFSTAERVSRRNRIDANSRKR
jgi:hypothetical protein